MPSDDFMYNYSEKNPLKKTEYEQEEYEGDESNSCIDSQ